MHLIKEYVLNSKRVLNIKGLGTEGGAIYHVQYPAIGVDKITKISIILSSLLKLFLAF